MTLINVVNVRLSCILLADFMVENVALTCGISILYVEGFLELEVVVYIIVRDCS